MSTGGKEEFGNTTWWPRIEPYLVLTIRDVERFSVSNSLSTDTNKAIRKNNFKQWSQFPGDFVEVLGGGVFCRDDEINISQ